MTTRYLRWTVRLVVAGLAVLLAGPASAQFNNGRMTRPEVNLPDGPVRQVILASCTSCHGIDDYAYHALDRAGWHVLVDAMVDKGAAISNEGLPTLLDWLVAEFGPESTPFPRDYVVTPVDSGLFADTAAATAYVTTTCGACHSLDRLETARFSAVRWKATVKDMQGRGAAVADENVEALVEYLTRTRGAN